MTEQKWIDPFSHPDDRGGQDTLDEAVAEAFKQFQEQAVGKKTGVRHIGKDREKILFYVRNEKDKEKLPKLFKGYECRVKVVGNTQLTY